MATKIKPLDEQMIEWFRKYGSHVILHRAVPAIEDGLKPSQRRVLHSLWELEDGRLNKVANAVGNTLKYHPHGDLSVFETMVGLGQKGYVLDIQGNWGDILTGDRAAAARYIEARLSPLAKENIFNAKTTEWIPTYDGKYKEPKTLSCKLPLLLIQGTEGIAVSLACKILPHNFEECCDASILYLCGADFQLNPDFAQGGTVDLSAYNEGAPGGKVKIRAKIEKEKHALVITEIPYGTTTLSLMESILKAEGRGSIKIKKVSDDTSETARVVVEYPSDTDLDQAQDALYALTECEVSHTVCGVVIKDGKPAFLGTKDLLKASVDRTKWLIGEELRITLEELNAQWHRLNLEKIFIETSAYLALKTAASPEAGRAAIRVIMAPRLQELRHEPTEDDIGALTEIKIRRISAYDSTQGKKDIEGVEIKEREARKKLKKLTETTIAHYEGLLAKYAKNHPRRTTISKEAFGKIQVAEVARASQKIFCDYIGGFIGTSLRKDDQLPFEVNSLTDIVAIGKNGVMKVCRPGAKTFYTENLLDVRLVEKNGHAPIYNMIYWDKSSEIAYAKRFKLDSGFTREKIYALAGKSEDNKVLFLAVTQPDAKPPRVKLEMTPDSKARKKEAEVDFSTLAIKGRESNGNIVSRHRVKAVKELKA